MSIDSKKFYSEWYGHKYNHLKIAYENLLSQNPSRIIFFAGDSSLDNKAWIDHSCPSVNGYEAFLNPPESVPDVCWNFNDLLHKHEVNFKTLNTSVEASTLESRFPKSVWTQDEFIIENIREQDILVISVGGNDIALNPSSLTSSNLKLILQNPPSIFQTTPEKAKGIDHFVSLFKDNIENYIRDLTKNKRPSLIIVCMIYFPDVKETGSWADGKLKLLNYQKSPEFLQTVIKSIYEVATKKIKVDDIPIIPFPLFEVLDGMNSDDYVSRVEPSPSGGRKIAEQILKLIYKHFSIEPKQL